MILTSARIKLIDISVARNNYAHVCAGLCMSVQGCACLHRSVTDNGLFVFCSIKNYAGLTYAQLLAGSAVQGSIIVKAKSD